MTILSILKSVLEIFLFLMHEFNKVFIDLFIRKSPVVTAFVVAKQFCAIFFEVFFREFRNKMNFTHNIDLLKRVENMTVVFRLVTVELTDWILLISY